MEDSSMTFRTRALLLFVSISLSFVAAVAIADCTAAISAQQTSPAGMYLLTATGAGTCSSGSVTLKINGFPLGFCLTSPCTVEWPLGITCGVYTGNLSVDCYKTTANGCWPDDRPGYATITVESDHTPTVKSKDVQTWDSWINSRNLAGFAHIHAPAAWFDRHMSYDWLPSLTHASTVPISNVVPEDADLYFDLTIPPGSTFLKATITSCSDKSDSTFIAVDDNACCCGQPSAPTCVAHPISVATGNMRMSDSDPLPSIPALPLTRFYDSSGPMRRFGQGWMSLFDTVTTSFPSDGTTFVIVETEGTRYIFRHDNGAFRQVWPPNGIAATLVYDGASGTYALHQPQHDIDIVARAGDGAPLSYRSRSTGREVSIAYANGLPSHVSDSWGNWGWTVSTDAATGRITAIALDGTGDTWQYTYDASGALTGVQGPNNAPWRSYTYAGGHLTEARDAARRLIESHQYDSRGRATTSASAQDNVQSVRYYWPSSTTAEVATSVTSGTGSVAVYKTKYVSGRPRTSEVSGSCSGCGVNDAVYAYDEETGDIVREQDARGYVLTRIFAQGRLMSVTSANKPAGCDPETDANHCRLTSASLAMAVLEPTPATTTTTYAYGDVNWSDRPTAVTTTSVANPAQSRIVHYTYDATTGNLLEERTDGWRTPADAESITSNTVLYDGAAVAAFNPGGAFDAAWLSLPQPLGAKRSFDGPRTDVVDLTEWVYYPVNATVPALLRGHVAAVRDASGSITRFEAYDAFGNATRVVDANGVATESTYDFAGRLLTSTLKGVAGCDTSVDPLCATDLVTQRSYAPALGPLVSETRPNGGTTTYEYDDVRRMTAMTRAVSAAAFERAEYDYDAATGKRSAERYKSGQPGAWTLARSEAFAYDVYARLHEIDHPDGTKIVYTYDATGNVNSVKDERHATPNTTYSYDPLNRLAVVTQTLSTAPGGSIATHYAYDTAGNLTSVTDPNGNTTSYAFDDFGRMSTQTSPVTGTTSYSYDPAGNLASTTDANGATTTRAYDAVGRVTAATSTRPGALDETVAWSYGDDPTSFSVGRVTSMTDPSGVASYMYDRRGLLISESKSFVYATFTSIYGYDADGNRTTITYPSFLPFVIGYPNARTISYAFDYADRPVAASLDGVPIVTIATYRPFGPRNSIAYGNATTRTVTFDNRYRVQENKLTAPAGTIADYTYTSDGSGNVLTIHDLTDPAYNRDFNYDDLSRLLTATTGASLWLSGSYSYDALGNMMTMSLGVGASARAVQFQYEGAKPKLLFVTTNGTTVPIGYDNAGNETSYIATRSYDARNHLERVDAPSGSTTFAYDGRGVRVASGGGTAPFSLYSPELHLLSRFNQSFRIGHPHDPVLLADFIWFGDEPVGQSVIENGIPTMRYTFTDHLGTPILQTDDGAAVVWRAEYEPFGSVYSYRAGNRDDVQILRFPGQELAEFVEDGTDQAYNIFRWYRAGWGRYTQPDPIGLKGGMNLYRYANANPALKADPTGLSCTAACPECPGKTWVFYGVNTGFLVSMGSMSYGASVGISDAVCLSSSKTCTFFIFCARGWGFGLSANVAAVGGLAFNAPCSDDVGGVSWGIDVDVYKRVGGSLGGSVSPSGSFQLGGGVGLGVGASGSFQICQATKISCR
jgi:RHS repeat-associated protein